MFKELFTERVLNEGTPATIVVKVKDTYKVSVLQYDGYPENVIKALEKKYNSQKDAEKLVTKTGEIRSLDPLEYYTDRKILFTTKDENKAVKKCLNTGYSYFWDGEEWWYDDYKFDSFDEMMLINQED